MDTPSYVADYFMTQMIDATANTTPEYRKECLNAIIKRCQKEIDYETELENS